MKINIGRYLIEVEQAAADLERHDVLGRLRRKDHTVWGPEPAEITDRLGWLDVPGFMRGRVPDLVAFAGEVCRAGFRHVVLLGMGGSSLGPEVLKQTFGSQPGYPELIVLDSTLPDAIRAVTAAVQPERTLCLVSSKSGTTVETVCLFGYFRERVAAALGEANVGQSFVAITDSSTPLAEKAAEDGFRRVFLNPPDIGGRYSVLSYFGLVPAVLMGIDIERLLARAENMRRACAAPWPLHRNPGAWLGVIVGRLALAGRDKLTLLTSPGIGGFGLWVEQLLAESTGKGGRGIVPVIGEPMVGPGGYGDDRLFVYLRLSGDDNAAADAAIGRIEAAGQPVVVLDVADRYDLGAEFYRWELATAVAGVVLGVNPFDQPDVQATKRATTRILDGLAGPDLRPQPEATGSLAGLLERAVAGKYLAILAYLPQTGAADAALTALRRKVLEKCCIATMLGYGPRYLHSTGQLHKGGPDTGLFLQLTSDYREDLPVPGRPYTFGQLADAQALADRQTLEGLGRSVARHHLRGVGDIFRLI